MRIKELFCLFFYLVLNSADSRVESSILRHKRMVGGIYAVEDQFKYAVSVRSGYVHTCGGGIIADQYILTAAHCAFRPDGSFDSHLNTVVVGTIDLNLLKYSNVFKIEKIYVPPQHLPVNSIGFKGYYVNADIAVIKLKRKLHLDTNFHLKKLELPLETVGMWIDEKAVIAGYGVTLVQNRWNPVIGQYELSEESDNKLKSAIARVRDNSVCNKYFKTEISRDDRICAQLLQYDASLPQGTCWGDSGGVLVDKNNVVIGVLSYGSGHCNEQLGASVYTKVSAFLPFIRDAMADVPSEAVRVFKVNCNTLLKDTQ